MDSAKEESVNKAFSNSEKNKSPRLTFAEIHGERKEGAVNKEETHTTSLAFLSP